MDYGESFSSFFDVGSQNASDKARCYLQGLLMKAPRKNMERMEEYVAGCDYQAQQQFLSDSPWNHRALTDEVARQTSGVLGGRDSALVIDESCFEKKGKMSVGVANQWLGRLGKVDNGQVGVFAALSDGKGGALIDARLYLPESWTEDPERCAKAKVPEAMRNYRSKTELALEMVRHAVALRLDFGFVAFDALYGSTPWLLREIEDMGLVFVADVRHDASVYLEDPGPYVPGRRGGRGAKPTKRRARTERLTIADFFSGDFGLRWEEVAIRDGTKGTLRVSAARKRVWLWDGEEKVARCWWAVCTFEESSGDTKFFLCNEAESAALEKLVRMHAVRFWVERTFQDAKTSLGMADYQARGWVAWHHHMAMVMLAMLFLLRERRVHMMDVELLSCTDIVELLTMLLPRRDTTFDAVVKNIERRHRKRRDAIESARRTERERRKSINFTR